MRQACSRECGHAPAGTVLPDKVLLVKQWESKHAWVGADCWDCEVHTTYGWIECAGLADRSAFDLTAHAKASKKELVAYETFEEPRTLEVVEVVPNMKILGKELKQAGKKVADHLMSLPEDEAMALKVPPPHPMNSCFRTGRFEIGVCTMHLDIVQCMYRWFLHAY